MKKRTKITLWSLGLFSIFGITTFTLISYFCVKHLEQTQQDEIKKRNEFLNSLIPTYVNEVFPNTTLLIKKTEISNQENTPVENVSYFTSRLILNNDIAYISEQINNKSNYFIKNEKTFIVDEIKFEYEYGINVKNINLDDIKWKYFSMISSDYYVNSYSSEYWISTKATSEILNNKYLSLPKEWEWNSNINIGFSIKNNIANYESNLIQDKYDDKKYEPMYFELTLNDWMVSKGEMKNLYVFGTGIDINLNNMIDGSFFINRAEHYNWSDTLNKLFFLPALTCLI